MSTSSSISCCCNVRRYRRRSLLWVAFFAIQQQPQQPCQANNVRGSITHENPIHPRRIALKQQDLDVSIIQNSTRHQEDEEKDCSHYQRLLSDIIADNNNDNVSKVPSTTARNSERRQRRMTQTPADDDQNRKAVSTLATNNATDTSNNNNNNSTRIEEENIAQKDSTHHHEGVIHIENSQMFQILFGTLLGMIFLVRTIICILLIRYRKDGNLQLAQPYVMATLIGAGSISIISCYFFIHTDATEQDIFCLLRDPFILTTLTLAGNILLGRVWRIVLLLTPVLTAGRSISHHESEEGVSCGNRSKGILMYHLTRMADVYYWIEWVRNNITTKITSRGHQKTMTMLRRRRRQSTATALRKKVPLQQLFLLTFLLTLPQLVFQILNLSVDTMQQQLVAQEMILFDGYVMEHHSCAANVGRWPIYVGATLAVIPYILTAVIAWNSADELPKVFNEAKAYTKCSKVIILVLAIVLPPLLLDDGTDPDSIVYLSSMLIFALTMPPCWFIVYPKIWQALTSNDRNQQTTQSVVRRLLRKKRSGRNFLPTTGREENGKSAKLALTIGKMYEEMGMAQKSIDLFDEALAVWECDPGRDEKEKIGGFTLEEINSFSVQDLEHIVQLLIAKGRVNGTFQVADDSGQKNAAQSWLDALEIYEKAPARAQMSDRSMLFPVFSGLFVFLKGGKIQQDSKCHFEQNLARKFVRETKLQGDPVHYTRALAMFCEVKARLGKYRVALETFETLKEIYDPEEHSEGVSNAYGTDRSAQAFSQSALWNLQLGDEAKAIEACEYVLDELMPMMDPKNVLNSCEMLLPIIYVYKPRGEEKRMKILFEKYVVNNHHQYFKEKSSPCEPVFKPLTMLLSICHDPKGFPNIADAVEWLVGEENGVASDFLDTIYTKLCWSMHSLTAELCLRLATLLIDSNGNMSDVHVLLLKGLKLAKQADKKMTSGKGKVTLPVAYVLHEPVYKELRELSGIMGISSEDDFASLHNSHNSFSQSSLAEARNVPSSYLKTHGSSDESFSSGSRLSINNNDDIFTSPNATTVSQFDSGATTSSSVDKVSISKSSRLDSLAEESLSTNLDSVDSIKNNNDDDDLMEHCEEDGKVEVFDCTKKEKNTASGDTTSIVTPKGSDQLHVTFSSTAIQATADSTAKKVGKV